LVHSTSNTNTISLFTDAHLCKMGRTVPPSFLYPSVEAIASNIFLLHLQSSVPLLRNTKTTLEMIKWEHSIFALPFALCAAMLAARGMPTGWQLAWIVVAMVSARSAAMSFNRLADASIDSANPRTRTRALAAGILTQNFVRLFVIFSSAIFVLAAWALTRLAF